MSRVILGFLKGLIVGGGIGFALLRLGWNNSLAAYAGCALVGALVGVVCGRPPWRTETIWTPVVKMIVGGLVGAGACWAGLKLPGIKLAAFPGMDISLNSAGVLSTAIGVLYGIFVEVDDGAPRTKNPTRSPSSFPPAGPASPARPSSSSPAAALGAATSCAASAEPGPPGPAEPLRPTPRPSIRASPSSTPSWPASPRASDPPRPRPPSPPSAWA